MANRQDLIDAILELTRQPHFETYCLSFLLVHADTQLLGQTFDALADYDDVRKLAAGRRSGASEARR